MNTYMFFADIFVFGVLSVKTFPIEHGSFCAVFSFVVEFGAFEKSDGLIQEYTHRKQVYLLRDTKIG